MRLVKQKMKKVDLKVVNGKYSISFNEDKKQRKQEPLILGMNGQNEIRIMVNKEEDESTEELVNHIRSAFAKYINEMKNQTFERKTFIDITMHKESDAAKQELVDVAIESDQLILSKGKRTEVIPFKNIEQLYAKRVSDFRNSYHRDKEMLYALQYEIWIMVQTAKDCYAFSSSSIEKFFLALSQAYFMNQIKRKEIVNE